MSVENEIPDPVYTYLDGFVATVWRPNSGNTKEKWRNAGENAGENVGDGGRRSIE